MHKVKYKPLTHLEQVFLLLLTVMIALPSAVSGQETYRFERMWPTLPQPWYFGSPWGIAVGPDGLVYVFDTDYARIQKFTGDGLFITRWGREGLGEGEFGRCEGGGCNLRNGIAFDGNGNVYVTDTINNRVQKFTQDGTFITMWGKNQGDDGSSGTGIGEFWWPSDIAVDSRGFVYVADYWNNRIQKFTSAGHFVTKWGRNDGDGSDGTGDGEFNRPSSLAVDSQGFVYVADEHNHRIQKFTADGAFILQWDNTHPNGAHFLYPADLTTGAEGHIYVICNREDQQFGETLIYKINQNGELMESWSWDKHSPSVIARDESGCMYVTERVNNKIIKLTPEGEIINTWASYGKVDDEPQFPDGIAAGKNGAVYLSDCQRNRIQMFNAEGAHIKSWNGPDTEDEIWDCPKGIAVDSFGDVYVSVVNNNRIQKFTADGQFITMFGDDLLLRPEAIALDSGGNVYIIDIADTLTVSYQIQKFKPNPDGLSYDFADAWNTWGNNQKLGILAGIAIGRDEAGGEYVYATEWGSSSLTYYVHKFTLDGQYMASWTGAAPGNALNRPWGLATDDHGNVYVADSLNYRVCKFNHGGELLASFGLPGSSPGQVGKLCFITVDAEEKVYVADKYNNRIQVFTKAESIENSRAIIVAGGGAYPGNSLWDATQMTASFAYRALTYQGFTKQDITYLSEDTALDLDDDGESNVEEAPTNLSLNGAIQDAADANAENLMVYLSDHGGTNELGEGTFRLRGYPDDSETLTASGLASMLDVFPGRVIVIIDACQSGSFMSALQGANRIIITSTQPDEQAKFINQGTISFSNFFWTGVFNGSSIWDSYNTARGAVNILADQRPDLWYPLDVNPEHVYIGNGVEGMVGEAPVIGSIATSPNELHLETQAEIHANAVTDPDGITRVWAVIWPPHFDPGSVSNPLTDLPSVDLLPTDEEGNYAGTYGGFVSMGIYPIAVYAMDRKGTTSQPRFMTLSRNLTRRAIIVGGGAGGELNRLMINKNTSLAYNALLDQFYDPDDIYFMSVDGIPGFDVAPSVFYLGLYLEDLAGPGIDNLDLTVYLIGSGDTGTFAMNDNEEVLTASQLDAWLDDLQESKPSRVTIIYDGNRSGSFIPTLMPPEGKERIIITSTGPESTAYYKTEGSISFSSFFWDRIAAGLTIGNAYQYATSAISYCTREYDISFSCYRPQHPLIDANGNGIANETTDYQIAEELHLGDGVAYADDPPTIGQVSVSRQGNLLTVTAEDVDSTTPVERVWAVIRPMGYCPGTSEALPQQAAEAELLDTDGDGTYQGSKEDVYYPCKVTVYAMNLDAQGEPNISSPSEPIINQPGGDIYEDPDGDGIHDDETADDPSQANVIVVNHPSPQPHTFHHPDDEDWVKFYGVTRDFVYTIEAGNLGVNCPVIELYKEGNLRVPIAVAGGYPVDNKVFFDFKCTQDGIYYVRLFRGDCTYIDGEMSYDLQVYDVYIELTATVAGRVENSVTGKPIDGAVISSDGVAGATLSTRGEYMISEIPGSWTITARKDRYDSSHYGIRIDTNDQYIRQDIDMDPRDTGECTGDAHCDDGLFCNGNESCVERICQQGTPPCADDGIFCNGTEACNEETDACEHTGNPCPQDLTCDEERDVCAGCLQDAQCDDGLFCTGMESCLDGICIDGADPCSEGVECDEGSDTCLIPEISVIPRTIMQSRWLPLPLFMSIRGTNTHFSGVSKVSFSPTSIMAMPPFVINEHSLFCMGLLMPAWITGSLGEELEIKVTTGLENATGTVEVNLMPFMLGEKNRRQK